MSSSLPRFTNEENLRLFREAVAEVRPNIQSKFYYATLHRHEMLHLWMNYVNEPQRQEILRRYAIKRLAA
jgi:hypothetical protein